MFRRLEQFQEKCVAVFRPELRKKELERFSDFCQTLNRFNTSNLRLYPMAIRPNG
ncbi:hypothetical protein [Mesorhizobium dulcispinae]|uniref:hypothetical protein n=1 Tax=Mesorhizobium dulcispinae TaxID=3072316 RepID=UPI002A23A259|nr:hypothetical protein [Mesorhizobium sp. VK23D]